MFFPTQSSSPTVSSDSPDERAKRFSRVGEVCGSLQPAYFIDLYRQATSQDDRRDRMHLLLNIPVKPFDRLVSTELRRALNEAATETDPELRHWASVQLATLASYENEQGLQRKKAEQDVVRWRYALAGALIAASVLGIFIFLWGFRMLQLRRLLQHLAPASARTVTLGLTSLRGEVQPYDGRMLVHPVTEESCIYYAGVEGRISNPRFWLVDDTGRVLVDPQGVVLISEDQTLVPGEYVHILGTAVRTKEADGTTRIVVQRGADEPMLVERLLMLPVRLLFGVLGTSERIAATLFTRPERSFWIWDDLHQAPMTIQRDLATVFVSMLAAAGWITLFVAAAIAVLGQPVSGQF